MSVGQDATQAGYPLVSNTGPDGYVRDGAREINRTRDFIAQVKGLISNVWPVAKGGTGANNPAGARTNLELLGKMTYSTSVPSGGNPGDIHFQYIP